MLLLDTREIGNRLFAIRKKYGMTQNEVAEASGLANRTYADIERGTVKMRVDTIIHICNALHITPDEILTIRTNESSEHEEEIIERLHACSPKDKATALQLLSIYLKSLE